MKCLHIPHQRHCESQQAPLVSEAVGRYLARKLDDAQISRVVAFATELLRVEMARHSYNLNAPRLVMDYLRMKLAGSRREIFGVVFLNAQHQVIADEEMFIGTLTQTSVYPREVVSAALRNNAAALLLYHNHPSDVTEPSRADELLTQTLKSSLQLIDVKVLDHIVVGTTKCVSFAERGLI
jgi:DNA repair protein RadC